MGARFWSQRLASDSLRGRTHPAGLPARRAPRGGNERHRALAGARLLVFVAFAAAAAAAAAWTLLTFVSRGIHPIPGA
jgi:hypothetical protein